MVRNLLYYLRKAEKMMNKLLQHLQNKARDAATAKTAPSSDALYQRQTDKAAKFANLVQEKQTSNPIKSR